MQVMKPRKLLVSEVTFTVELEPEDIPVRGHFMSGDPEYEQADRELEDRIVELADNGYVEAWCCIKVTASWNGHKWHAYLGANSFLDGEATHMPVDSQVKECVDDHGLKGEALDDLNSGIRATFDALAPLLG